MDVDEERFLADDIADRGPQAVAAIDSAGLSRGSTAAVFGSTSACRPTRRSVFSRPCGCSHAKSRAAQGRASPGRADQAGSGSTRRRHRRTTPGAAGTGSWPASTGRTPGARRRRRSRAAIPRAACCHCAGKPAPNMTTGFLSPKKPNRTETRRKPWNWLHPEHKYCAKPTAISVSRRGGDRRMRGQPPVRIQLSTGETGWC